jgi:ADP-ribose pyrophosphatase
MSAMEWERVRSDVERDHGLFVLRRDVSICPRTGDEHDVIVLESRDWVAVVALTSADELVLIRQYRHGTREVTLEIPGGLVDDGLTPEQAARAELRQETGYAGDTWTLLGSLTAVPALFTNRVHVFLAQGVRRVGAPELEPGEDILTELVPGVDVEAMISKGDIIHAQVIAALYLFALWRRGHEGGSGASRSEGAL